MLREEDPLPRLLLKRRRATKRLEVADLDFHGVTSEELSPAASASHRSKACGIQQKHERTVDLWQFPPQEKTLGDQSTSS